jgi:hypothetical protein
VNFCTPLIRYVEGSDTTAFVEQLNDSENIIDDQPEPALPELPELSTASGHETAFRDNEAFSEGGYVMNEGKCVAYV